jgi:hypothetical protein
MFHAVSCVAEETPSRDPHFQGSEMMGGFFSLCLMTVTIESPIERSEIWYGNK